MSSLSTNQRPDMISKTINYLECDIEQHKSSFSWENAYYRIVGTSIPRWGLIQEEGHE